MLQLKSWIQSQSGFGRNSSWASTLRYLQYGICSIEGMREGDRGLIPARFQVPLPWEKLVVRDRPSNDAIQLDALFVGAGPAGLAGAIQLKKYNPGLEIGVLEKASQLGEHCLSGAIMNPKVLFDLFPELTLGDFPFDSQVSHERLLVLTHREHLRVPAPLEMRNRGYYVASICELVRWLGKKAEELGIHIFTGFAAQSLLMKDHTVIGVRTAPSGLTRNGLPGPAYLPPADLVAKVCILSEGSRGLLTQAYFNLNKISSKNPQLYALGVKELWQTSGKFEMSGLVTHTLGWPVPKDSFGGGWVYPMANGVVSLGLVVGLDYRSTSVDVHSLVQQYKEHPFLAAILDGGKLLEWGAKTIPEGGFYSIPEKLHGNGILITGDAAGLVNVASLKGIHYAMRSGLLAAKTLDRAFLKGDFSAGLLQEYDQRVNRSEVIRDLYRTRNMRLAFKSGFYRGAFKAELMALTRGKFPGERIRVLADSQEEKRVTTHDSEFGSLKFKKEDAVFYSGNRTRDDIPEHLILGNEVTPALAAFYSHMCPAGVYEVQEEKLVIHPANCIDCKATDVLGPRWMPREGGSGPRYKKM